MNNLEQQLIDIDERMADAIRKQKLSVAETIHKVAEDSINACMTLNDEFRAIFPELAKFESDTESNSSSTPFNPKFVIETQNGNRPKFIDTWDKIVGILPNRKVICKYYVNICRQTKLFQHSEKCIYCIEHDTYLSNNYTPLTDDKLPKLNSHYCEINCNCFSEFSSVSDLIHSEKFLFNAEPFVPNSYGTKPINICYRYEFEVDNYLNLYNKHTGLYILFNKNAFPAFPFLARPQVFQSKKILEDKPKPFDFLEIYPIKSCNLSNQDARPQILAAVPELIPDDYYKVIDFYDRFRQMTSYKRGLRQLGTRNLLFESKTTREIDSEELPPTGKEVITMDTRDKLILELESRLSGCLKQIELTDDYTVQIEL